eukprot:scaffold15998_cov71-Phaeocystis_antarctica.AAC.1
MRPCVTQVPHARDHAPNVVMRIGRHRKPLRLVTEETAERLRLVALVTAGFIGEVVGCSKDVPRR